MSKYPSTTVEVNGLIHRLVKIEAAKQDRTVKDIIETALRQYLSTACESDC